VSISGGAPVSVILAAGMGRRLGDRAGGRPKGFLEIGGRTLIERSLDSLHAAGVREVFIGTGFRSDLFEQLRHPGLRIRCVRNESFADTGSMQTLLPIASALAGRRMLLLESDLLYHRRGLFHLAACAGENIILASPLTQSGDEVYIETDTAGRLVGLSKDPGELGAVNAELTGLNKVGPDLSAAMVDFAKDRSGRLDYETVFAALAPKIRIDVEIFDFPWGEIDDDSHLQRALNFVLPAIEAEA